MKKILLLASYCYLTKMEMVLVSILLTAAFCAVRMEMLLAEAKYPNTSVLLIEKSPNKIPFNFIVEGELSQDDFFQKSSDKTSLLANTDYLE